MTHGGRPAAHDPDHPHGDGSPGSGPVVVGVHPGQGQDVARRAAQLARRLGVGLVCVWVDPASVLEHDADGARVVVPLDPDGDAWAGDDALRADLAAQLDGTGVAWSYERTAGEVRDGIVAAAEAHDATLVVVGTHKPGFGRWMETVIGTSVAGRLAHSQHRPVTVLPNLHHDHRVDDRRRGDDRTDDDGTDAR
ncbi:nucleotide-binding universal stress UspA family protein [Sediminihabitans luteus]|uniref:Nucleotide-binding universal stress UspA family protein n=1 Tax=Sediminihabitans luteus TaxID=1138585 RepID=A0A2M9D1E0_9CELL|nr:universal stress protein [Sediminihabitans luteus]PJJ77798.1 nucleotide-binding universal stress UspA family protein [Sediminihabitans luteus]GII99844.1 hypothetical protein Slu03_22220 [Sediminihabitans luteus]